MSKPELDDKLKVYLREIGKTALLTLDEEVQLAKRIRKGDMSARSHMIHANLRLVVKIAHDYTGYGVPLSDLISEGNIGLMKAVERFDPGKGAKFSTYAAWWIKQSIKRALANQGKTIRLPVHVVDKVSKMRRIEMAMAEDLGRDPTTDELADEAGIDPAKIAMIKRVARKPTSLDAPAGEDGDSTVGELVADERVHAPSEDLSHRDMLKHLPSLMTVLDERERKIIEARFGLSGESPKTLEDVGAEFGVTRERIRQLQEIALGKMRRALAKMEEPQPKVVQQLPKALAKQSEENEKRRLRKAS